MQVNALIEFIDAAMDTRYVQGPYEERGGLFLVAYPGALKSTILKAGLRGHIDAMVLSDLNVKQWIRLRDDFVTGRYTAMGFTDFEKIYQRHGSTSSHIEGIIKGLVAEGYGISPSQDSRMPVIPAYALVAGAMTNSCMEEHYDEWSKSGFLRRFIWLTYSVKNQNKIAEAIRRWEKINFGKINYRPASGAIDVLFADEQHNLLESMMAEQPGFNGPGYILLKKITAVLIWKYGNGNGGRRKVTDLLRDIAPAFSKNGGQIIL